MPKPCDGLDNDQVLFGVSLRNVAFAEAARYPTSATGEFSQKCSHHQNKLLAFGVGSTPYPTASKRAQHRLSDFASAGLCLEQRHQHQERKGAMWFRHCCLAFASAFCVWNVGCFSSFPQGLMILGADARYAGNQKIDSARNVILGEAAVFNSGE